MNYFTFKKGGKPIAMVDGGDHHNKIIYIHEDDSVSDSDEDIGVCCHKCGEDCLTKKKCCKNCNYLNGGCGNCDDDFSYDKIFKKEINKFKKGQMEFIKLKDGGKIIPLPRIEDEQVSHLNISGPTGSGKSSFAALFIKQFLKVYPKTKVYIISGIEKDKVLDDIKPKPKRIKLDERMYKDPLELKLFKDSIIVFDDVDNIRDDKIKKAIQDFRNDLLANGRHENITVLALNHNPTNNKETKSSLAESNSIVLFPHGGDDYRLKRVLKEYLSIPQRKIDDILKLKSRWVFINKSYPRYLIHETGCYFPK